MATLCLGQSSSPSSSPSKPSFLIFLLSSPLQRIPMLNLQFTNIQFYTQKTIFHLVLTTPLNPASTWMSQNMSHREKQNPWLLPPSYIPHLHLTQASHSSKWVQCLFSHSGQKPKSHPSLVFPSYPKVMQQVLIDDSTSKTNPTSEPFSPFPVLPDWPKPFSLARIIQQLPITYPSFNSCPLWSILHKEAKEDSKVVNLRTQTPSLSLWRLLSLSL